MITEDSSGLAVWCNNCNAFPDQFNIRGYEDNCVIIKCLECGENEVFE